MDVFTNITTLEPNKDLKMLNSWTALNCCCISSACESLFIITSVCDLIYFFKSLLKKCITSFESSLFPIILFRQKRSSLNEPSLCMNWRIRKTLSQIYRSKHSLSGFVISSFMNNLHLAIKTCPSIYLSSNPSQTVWMVLNPLVFCWLKLMIKKKNYCLFEANVWIIVF